MKLINIVTALFLTVAAVQAEGKPQVVFETTQGEVVFELMPEVAPKACENFIALAESGFYNGVIFHRVIKGFMIQSGDPTGTGMGGNSKWKRDFEDEFAPGVVFDKVGVLAMANRGRNTNGSQFFITTGPAHWLNGRHTIFGHVIKGYENVQKIENTPTGKHDRPAKEQRIIKAYLKK
jgi:peptidylprolyl isomerase